HGDLRRRAGGEQGHDGQRERGQQGRAHGTSLGQGSPSPYSRRAPRPNAPPGLGQGARRVGSALSKGERRGYLAPAAGRALVIVSSRPLMRSPIRPSIPTQTTAIKPRIRPYSVSA